MAESKYGKYIVTDVKQDLQLPSYRVGAIEALSRPTGRSTRIVWLDGGVVPGAFYSECLWFWPEAASDKVKVEAHKHDFSEVIAFFGTNFDDPHDLCGEVELWLEDEKHVMTKSFLAFIPVGMKHCPLIIRRIDKPMFHFTIGPGSKYA